MPASDPTAALGFSGSISGGYHSVLKAKARIYMNSFPGPDNVGTNAVHAKLKQFDRKQYLGEMLVILNDTLDYRISTMQLASKYVSFLELQFPGGLEFDMEAWCNDLSLQAAKADCPNKSKGEDSKVQKSPRIYYEHKALCSSCRASRLKIPQTKGLSCYRAHRVIIIKG